MLNITEVEKIVSKISQELFKNSNSFSIGMMKSHFRGSGLQFKEHQIYNPGDDTRFIDWKLSAKTSKTYIKTFEEERNVEIVACISFSKTLLYGYKQKTKFHSIMEIICLIYLLAEKTNDYVRLVFLYDKAYELPLKRGREGITYLITLLLKLGVINGNGEINESIAKTQIMESDKKIKNIQKYIFKNKEFVLLGDYSNFDQKDFLKNISYRKNMHCFQVLSPIDIKDKDYYYIKGFEGKSALSNFFQIKKAKTTEFELVGRIKTLKIDDHYLENFVKEMM